MAVPGRALREQRAEREQSGHPRKVVALVQLVAERGLSQAPVQREQSVEQRPQELSLALAAERQPVLR